MVIRLSSHIYQSCCQIIAICVNQCCSHLGAGGGGGLCSRWGGGGGIAFRRRQSLRDTINGIHGRRCCFYGVQKDIGDVCSTIDDISEMSEASEDKCT